MASHDPEPGQERALVRCPQCGHAFGSPLQVDRTTLESLVPETPATCPRCGRRHVFRKADHWFELVVEPGGSGGS